MTMGERVRLVERVVEQLAEELDYRDALAFVLAVEDKLEGKAEELRDQMRTPDE